MTLLSDRVHAVVTTWAGDGGSGVRGGECGESISLGTEGISPGVLILRDEVSAIGL